MMQNYQQLVEKIAKASGLAVDEIERKVEAKCAKLSGLISKEGSAQIVASELGISFEKEKLKVSELMQGMKRVNMIGQIVEVGTIREYNKNGRAGKVANLRVADESGSLKVVLWDTNHIGLFESGKLKTGDSVEISNGLMRNDELHLSGFSDIKVSNEVIENVSMDQKVSEKKLVDLKSGDNAKVRAIITQIYEPKFFEVCPECGKKATENSCAEHGVVVPKKKALVGIVVDDGTENMKGVLFSDQIKLLGINDEEIENPEFFMHKKEALIGKEALLTVNARTNKLFSNTELIINNIEEINLDELIQSLKN
jgi:hypothetical protein